MAGRETFHFVLSISGRVERVLEATYVRRRRARMRGSTRPARCTYIIAPKTGAAAASEANVAHEFHNLSALERGIDLLCHNGNVGAAEEVESSESGWPSKAVLHEGALCISGLGSNLYVKRGAIGAQRVR